MIARRYVEQRLPSTGLTGSGHRLPGGLDERRVPASRSGLRLFVASFPFLRITVHRTKKSNVASSFFGRTQRISDSRALGVVGESARPCWIREKSVHRPTESIGKSQSDDNSGPSRSRENSSAVPAARVVIEEIER